MFLKKIETIVCMVIEIIISVLPVAPKSVASYSFVLKGIRGSAFDFIVLKTICFGRSYSTIEQYTFCIVCCMNTLHLCDCVLPVQVQESLCHTTEPDQHNNVQGVRPRSCQTVLRALVHQPRCKQKEQHHAQFLNARNIHVLQF